MVFSPDTDLLETVMASNAIYRNFCTFYVFISIYVRCMIEVEGLRKSFIVVKKTF